MKLFELQDRFDIGEPFIINGNIGASVVVMFVDEHYYSYTDGDDQFGSVLYSIEEHPEWLDWDLSDWFEVCGLCDRSDGLKGDSCSYCDDPSDDLEFKNIQYGQLQQTIPIWQSVAAEGELKFAAAVSKDMNSIAEDNGITRQPATCCCDIVSIMKQGCQCGGI